MSDRFALSFNQLKKSTRKAFIPFCLLGWPDSDSSFEAAKLILETGCDAVLFGCGISHPVADNRTLRAATFELLSSGFGLPDLFALIEKIRHLDGEIPIGLLMYQTMIAAHGIDYSLLNMARSGVDALLIPDLAIPSRQILKTAQDLGLGLIPCISELNSISDIKEMGKHSAGFAYAFLEKADSSKEDRVIDKLNPLIANIRDNIDLPVCVGGGIANDEQTGDLLSIADGIVSGTKIIEIIDDSRETGDPLAGLEPYLLSMMDACGS